MEKPTNLLEQQSQMPLSNNLPPLSSQMSYGNNNNNNILFNNIPYNNTANTDNRNVGVLKCQATEQNVLANNNINTNNIQYSNNMLYDESGNISFRGSTTSKNNENVFCDLTKSFCFGCKCL